MRSRYFVRRSSSSFLVYSFWSSARMSSLPHPFLPPPLTLAPLPLAVPWVGFGILYTLPRLLYWKFFLRYSWKFPEASVLHETRVKVACPQDGQNCFVVSLQTLKQAWHLSTHVLRNVMREKPESRRLRGRSAHPLLACNGSLLEIHP